MSSGNLPELINEILQYLQNDVSTLHSCILVNRLWCRAAISLLWEDPFSNPVRNYDFIKIFLHNLSEDDKTKLNEYKIKNTSFPTKVLFNYSNFIKYVDTIVIIRSIESWIEVVNNPAVRLIYKLLMKNFILNEASLRTFKIDLYKDIDYCCFNDTLGLILQSSNFIRNIETLKVSFDTSRYGVRVAVADLMHLTNFVHSNCNSISTLYIEYVNYINNLNDDSILIDKYLSNMIDLQQNLKQISFSYYAPPLHHTLLSLKGSNTLNTIIFYKVSFRSIIILNEVFEQLNVLESVHILYCICLESNFIQQIINLTKPFKLKSLFVDEILQIESYHLLLQKSGDYLENIGLGTVATTSDGLKQQLLDLITKYCTGTKIKFFELLNHQYNQCISLAFDLIQNIGQNLNYLSICFDSIKYGFRHQTDDDLIELSSIVLRDLGQILPFELEYLKLSIYINQSDFEIFLKNSQNTYIKKLVIKHRKISDGKVMLFNGISRDGDEGLLHCIEKYITKKKRVKYLAIKDEFTGVDLYFLNDQVRNFELYDIKVKNYSSLDIINYDFISDLNE